MTTTARRVARIDFTATDLARTRRFYEGLGFAASGEPAPVVGAELALYGLPDARAERLTMRLGAQAVSFVAFDPPGRPYPADSTSTDLWFQHIAIAVSDMAEAHRRALAAGARPITRDGPQTLPANTGGVTAWKFRDPEGRPLELLFFPEGTGAEAWQARDSATPFMGIDHTAVAVGDADRAQGFFRGLGFSAEGATHNSGVGQERLDDVADDRCLVVPMVDRCGDGSPHVELLAYEVGARRPMPADTRADDVWATRVWVEAVSPSAGIGRAETGPPPELRASPDGHLVVLFPEGRSLDFLPQGESVASTAGDQG